LLGSKELLELPLRIQRFRLRLMRFCLKIVHVPDKNLVIADALPRAPVNAPSAAENEKVELANHFLCMEVTALSVTQKRLAEMKLN